jgi:tetratricopeptide (TPR) repeat protein
MAMEITKKIFGEQHPNYATTLNNLAAHNDNIGKYDEAIRLTNIAIEIKKKTIGEENSKDWIWWFSRRVRQDLAKSPAKVSSDCSAVLRKPAHRPS